MTAVVPLTAAPPQHRLKFDVLQPGQADSRETHLRVDAMSRIILEYQVPVSINLFVTRGALPLSVIVETTYDSYS